MSENSFAVTKKLWGEIEQPSWGNQPAFKKALTVCSLSILSSFNSFTYTLELGKKLSAVILNITLSSIPFFKEWQLHKKTLLDVKSADLYPIATKAYYNTVEALILILRLNPKS